MGNKGISVRWIHLLQPTSDVMWNADKYLMKVELDDMYLWPRGDRLVDRHTNLRSCYERSKFELRETYKEYLFSSRHVTL